MRLVSFQCDGGLRPGVLVDESVVEVRGLIGRAAAAGISGGSVREILTGAGVADLKSLGDAAREAAGELGRPLAEVDLGPPIPEPQKVLCIGMNYADHAAEAAEAGQAGGGGDPIVFPMFATSLIGSGAYIELPKAAPKAVDYEGELGVVIGSVCRRVEEREALAHVAGYMAVNDVSARDLQVATPQWTMGKGFDTSGPCGPCLVTADEIPDPQALELKTFLNGEEVQSSSTSLMIHPVARLIAYISSAITLVPGDIIATGTPAGVGVSRDPRVFLKEGDRVTVSISGIGELSNPVRLEV